MQAVCEGNQSAYQTLVGRHTRAISHYAYRMLGNHKDTEDITQETFLRMWTHSDKFKPNKSKLTTWLHRIAHNLCIDYLRKHGNTDLTERFDEIALTDDTSSTVDAKEKVERLYKAVMGLPEGQRSALTLCHFQNFSNQEAADILDVTIKALESNLTRARQKLRDIVGNADK